MATELLVFAGVVVLALLVMQRFAPDIAATDDSSAGPRGHVPGLDRPAAKQAVAHISSAAGGGPQSSLKAEAEPALAVLDSECARLRQLANGYPSGAIRADVWLDGAALADDLDALASTLRGVGEHALEERVLGMCVNATCQVQGHYHNIVGPRMLRYGAAAEARQDKLQALQRYGAIIADFTWLVDDWEHDADAPTGADGTALECLIEAIVRRLRLRADDEQAPGLRELRARAEALMARGVR